MIKNDQGSINIYNREDLLKRLKVFAGLKTKAKSAQFLLLVFNDTQFFKLPENKQKVIIENLLSYFDNLILGIDTPKKQNKHFTFLDIQNHIKNKVIVLPPMQI